MRSNAFLIQLFLLIVKRIGTPLLRVVLASLVQVFGPIRYVVKQFDQGSKFHSSTRRYVRAWMRIYEFGSTFLILYMLIRMYLAAQIPNEECRHRLFNVRYDLKIRFLNDSDVENVANSSAPIRWPSTVITPKSCQIASKNRLLFMIIVHSSVTNFKQREVMRSTWSNETTRLNFRYVFSTGRSLNVSIQKALEQEAEKYGDILQSYGVDNYKLLPVKIRQVEASVTSYNALRVDPILDVYYLRHALGIARRLSSPYTRQRTIQASRYLDLDKDHFTTTLNILQDTSCCVSKILKFGISSTFPSLNYLCKLGDGLKNHDFCKRNSKMVPYAFLAYSWIKFVHESCSHLNPTYIVKIDDDVDVNLYGMQNFLDEFRHVPRSVYCSTFKHIADRRPSSKYFLSTSEFPYRNLGIFCAGLAYTITFDLIPEMYKNVKIKRFVWLDDWYVTHALLHNVDFAIFDTSDLYLVSEEKRDAYRQLRQVLTDERPTPIFSHLRPRTFFTETKQQELWKRSQLCSNYSFLEI